MSYSMTRKHFRVVAEAIRDLPRIEDRKNMALTLAPYFHAFNPNFDNRRFFEACGIMEVDNDGTE